MSHGTYVIYYSVVHNKDYHKAWYDRVPRSLWSYLTITLLFSYPLFTKMIYNKVHIIISDLLVLSHICTYKNHSDKQANYYQVQVYQQE